jgi:FkbM family methyltransferase
MASPDFEASEVQTFLQQCESHDVVFDIGANVGFYSCLAASRGKRVLAFEPAPRNLQFLYRNLWSNGFSAVEVFPVGLGPKPGLMPIYGFGGITSFVPGWAQAPKNGSHFAPVATLDFLTSGKFEGQRILVKMDVEGFELDVLAGALKTLSGEPKPTWMVEILLAAGLVPGGISRKFAETFEVFWSRGYRCSVLGLKEMKVTAARLDEWIRDNAVEDNAHNFLFSGE